MRLPGSATTRKRQKLPWATARCRGPLSPAFLRSLRSPSPAEYSKPLAARPRPNWLSAPSGQAEECSQTVGDAILWVVYLQPAFRSSFPIDSATVSSVCLAVEQFEFLNLDVSSGDHVSRISG